MSVKVPDPMTNTTDPVGYYDTLANLETTRTPSIERFTTYEHFDAVIALTGDTLKRLTEESQ